MRKPRQFSITGIYSIVIRGINKQSLFEYDEDYARFLDKLDFYVKMHRVKLLGYCIMDNHAHILIQTRGETPEALMRSQNTSYAMYFNRKYIRTGPLLDGRYKSTPIVNQTKLAKILRYIYRNPIKAGLCKETTEYKYSDMPKNIRQLKASALWQLVGNECKAQKLLDYINKPEEPKKKMTGALNKIPDAAIKALLRKNLSINTVAEFQRLPKEIRNAKLIALKKKQYPIKQISRVTGIPTGIIARLN